MKPSCKLLNILLITCFCIICSGNLHSQTQIIVNIQQPPFNQLNTEDLWKISLNNTTENVLSVYLFATLSEENAGLIATGTSSVFTLNPGMQMVNTHELTPISIYYPNPDMRYKESMLRRGGVPTGNYEICVSVKKSGSNEEVGSNCIQQGVEISSPISLITPDYGEEISSQLPVFTWMHLKKPSSGAYYTITVVEILSNQTPEVAIQTNLAWFIKDKINKTLLQYPISARSFEHGKKYAWKVDVFEEGSLLTESDIGLFKYNREEYSPFDIIYPKVGEEIEVDAVSFEWFYNMQADNSFSIKVVELMNDQSPEAAIKENSAFWEMYNILQTRINYPKTGPRFENGKTYAWQVSAFDSETLLAKSDVQTFIIGSDKSYNLDIIFPKVGEEIEGDGLYFEWKKYYNPESIILYTIKIVEVLDTQTPETAMEINEYRIEKNSLETSMYLYYSELSDKLDAGKYAWQIKAYDESELLAESELGTFKIIASHE